MLDKWRKLEINIMNNDKYQKRLEELGGEELKNRVEEVGKVVKERASYHAKNIIAQLISEKFDRYNIDERQPRAAFASGHWGGHELS